MAGVCLLSREEIRFLLCRDEPALAGPSSATLSQFDRYLKMTALTKRLQGKRPRRGQAPLSV